MTYTSGNRWPQRFPRWIAHVATSFLIAGSLAATAPAKQKSDSQKPTYAKKKAAATPQLSMQLRKIRNAKGRVGCALFNSPAGFPLKPEKAVRQLWCPIEQSNATCTVSRGLPPGTYAAVCIHDENGNGTLDTNWIGLPKEGVVASNHAKGRFGPPSFKDAAFSVGRKPKTIHMRIGY